MDEEMKKLIQPYLDAISQPLEEDLANWTHEGIPEVLWDYIVRISHLAQYVERLARVASNSQNCEVQALGKVLALIHADYKLIHGLAWEEESDQSIQ
jgi:hypothetical protein